MFSIKEKYKKKVVGFNGSATPLGERTDLLELAEIAVRSNDPSLLIVFKKVPTEEDVKAEKEKQFFQEQNENNEKPTEK
ncbi:hypothetical protein [Chryseobacterium gambrini]|uniref:hypothetical protein n=1 Tax=Chryseobacterium gambrini TaxID=373672 RepID=UPI003D0D251D